MTEVPDFRTDTLYPGGNASWDALNERWRTGFVGAPDPLGTPPIGAALGREDPYPDWPWKVVIPVEDLEKMMWNNEEWSVNLNFSMLTTARDWYEDEIVTDVDGGVSCSGKFDYLNCTLDLTDDNILYSEVGIYNAGSSPIEVIPSLPAARVAGEMSQSRYDIFEGERFDRQLKRPQLLPDVYITAFGDAPGGGALTLPSDVYYQGTSIATATASGRFDSGQSYLESIGGLYGDVGAGFNAFYVRLDATAGDNAVVYFNMYAGAIRGAEGEYILVERNDYTYEELLEWGFPGTVGYAPVNFTVFGQVFGGYILNYEQPAGEPIEDMTIQSFNLSFDIDVTQEFTYTPL